MDSSVELFLVILAAGLAAFAVIVTLVTVWHHPPRLTTAFRTAIVEAG